jgi:hypothetical protein
MGVLLDRFWDFIARVRVDRDPYVLDAPRQVEVRIVESPSAPASEQPPMNPYLAAIKAEARTYKSYLYCNTTVPERGLYLCVTKKNFELYGAIYRISRRKVLNIA